MKTKIFIAIAIASLASMTQLHVCAVTIPAGATLVVQTLQAISSVDVPGTPFPAQRENNVVVNGKAVLPAGTTLSGKIETWRRSAVSTQRLTVNITEVHVGGRAVPIKTTGAYRLDNEN